MRKFKRIGLIVLAALLLAGLFACKRSEPASEGSAEVMEFDFRDASDGIPKGWSVNSYLGKFEKRGNEAGELGFQTLNDPDDIRFVQTVAVKPETRYVLSAEIRAIDVQDGQGVTLSIDNYEIDGSFIYSDGIYGTTDWTPVELAFRTAKSQETVTLALRLGGYSAVSSGCALFRNVKLEQTEVASVPFQNLVPAQGEAESEEQTVEDYENVFTVIFWLGTIAAIVLLFGFLQKGKELAFDRSDRKHLNWVFLGVVFAGLIVRIVLCAKLKGHSTDMSCWKGWGYRIAVGGTRAFYVDNWCDYPPGYMLVCGLLYRISGLFENGPEWMGLFVYMIPAFVCDVLSGCMILKLKDKFGVGDKLALLLAGLIVLNPAALYLSGAWGQIDSILTALLIGAFLILNESREKPYYRVFAGLLYGVAILMKWQALIFGPVLALMYLMTGIDQWNTKKFRAHVIWSIVAVLGAVGVLMLASVLFRGEGMSFFWMVERYKSASGGYDYASVEAYNFITLFGGNWAAMHDRLGNALPMFGSANAGEIILKCNELFSGVALLIGFPTLIMRAWNELRADKNKRQSRALYELLLAAAVTVLFAFLHFVGKSFIADGIVANGLVRMLAGFPMHGLFMLGLFGYIAYSEGRPKLFDWIKEGGTTATGVLTMFAALCVFAFTCVLGMLLKLFGGALSWHLFGVIGIVTAGVYTAALFVIYWIRHRASNRSLYVNRGLIFLLAACFCVWVFTFGHYMHERYVFPALFLLIFAYAYDRDPHKLAAFGMLTVTTFMNEMTAMYVVSDGAKDLIRGGVLHNQMIALISLLEFGAAMYLAAVCLKYALVFDPGDPTGEGARGKAAAGLRPKKRGERR